jgi:hypothetical protein
VPEIVDDGTNGLLVPPGDENALLAALTCLAADPALRSRLAQAGLERVRHRFTIEQMVRRVEAIYEELYALKAGERPTANLATGHSQLVTRHSPLVTGHSPQNPLGEEAWK